MADHRTNYLIENAIWSFEGADEHAAAQVAAEEAEQAHAS